MGVPTSKVGYTAAVPRREGHEVNKAVGRPPKGVMIPDAV